MTPTSTPTLTSYDPDEIPYHREVINKIRGDCDYGLGVHEILLSGSVGSGKSTLLSHLVLTHVLFNPGSRFLIGRLSMPALRSTLFNKILEHIGSDLVEGFDYFINLTTATIRFRNGSEIISRSWADKKYFKVRSLELSGAAIEEVVETKESDFYSEIKMRVGRLPHVKENLIINATNPDSPGHWVYKYFIEPNSGGKSHPTRHVYYSVSAQNKFLPKQYLAQLAADLDPKMARRMLYGEWIELTKDIIYYSYDSSLQYSKDKWKPDPGTKIIISFDFNIGVGKPMSAVAMCFQDGCFHIFDEVVVEGARTEDVMDEFFDRGIIRQGEVFELDGDSSGRNRSTNSKRSDYDIIKERLFREGINYVYKVRLSNPPVRTRHNLVNAYCHNSVGERRLFVHGCKVADEALRLTVLKKGASYIEDDSKYYQHIGTAIGYAIVRKHNELNRPEQRTILL